MSLDDFWKSLFKRDSPQQYGAGFGPDALNHGPLKPQISNVFVGPKEQISEIVAKNPTPFRIFDIDCYSLDPNNFACIYDYKTLSQLVGYEQRGNGQRNVAGTDVTVDEPGANEYWRTVKIPFAGNFIKIEYLPARIQDESMAPTTFFSRLDGDPLPGAVDISFDTQGSANNYYKPLAAGQVNNLKSLSFQHQSKKMILVSFDAQQAIPLIVNDGDTIKAPFNVLYVTMKTGNPRVRVTIGYDTEIIPATKDKRLNASPEFGPGFGLWDSPLLHCVPFCLTNRTKASGSGESVATNSQTDRILVTESTYIGGGNPISTQKKGIACLWLSSFQTAVYMGNVTKDLIMIYTLYVADTANTLLRLVDKFRVVQPNASTDYASVNFLKTYPMPLRVTLHENERLNIYINNQSASATNFDYTINGYIYGRFAWQDLAQGNQLAISPLDYVAENPYFLDSASPNYKALPVK